MTRQEQAAATKDRIFETAKALMTKKGFANITIADIARKAGVSVGSFYNYFKSKEDILFEIYRRADVFFEENVQGHVGQGNALEQVQAYFNFYALFAEMSHIGFTAHLYSTDNKFFLKKGRKMQTILEDILREGQARNEITKAKSPEELVDLLFLVARGVVFDWGLNDGKYDLQNKMAELFALQVKLLEP